MPKFSPEAREANPLLVDLLGQIASGKQAAPAQVALAWLLHRKPWIAPIPGTTKLHRLKENVGAADITLDNADLQRIEDALGKVTVQDDRYPAHLAAMTGK